MDGWRAPRARAAVATGERSTRSHKSLSSAAPPMSQPPRSSVVSAASFFRLHSSRLPSLTTQAARRRRLSTGFLGKTCSFLSPINGASR